MQKDTFYQIRRELHQHPELSGHEARTARFVEDKLQAFHPTKVIRHVGGHGLLVEYFFSEDGPTVLFRADMDAVAVQEPDDCITLKKFTVSQSKPILELPKIHFVANLVL